MYCESKSKRNGHRGELALLLASALATAPAVAAGGAGLEGAATEAGASSQELHATVGFAPVVGQERYYDVHSRGTAGINFEALAARVSPSSDGPAKGKMQDHKFDITARLGMRVLAKVGDEWHVAMRLADVHYEIDGSVESRTKPLETPFRVRVSARGELRSFEFPVHFPEEAQLAIRSLVEPMQVVIVEQNNAAWTVGEKSVSGSSTVSYRVSRIDEAAKVVHITREVTAARRALSTGVALDEQKKFNARVDASKGAIEWALDGSGIKSISLRETTTSFDGKQPMATSDTTFTATLVPTPVAGLPKTDALLTASLKDPALARAQFYRVPGYLQQQLEGLTWETALSLYMQKVNTEAPASVNMMKFFLRLHPAHARDFAVALNEVAKAERTDALADVVGYGFAAIAAAGHTEAQQVLVDVISQPTWEPLTQEKALDGMLSLEMPERFVPAAVWNVRRARLTANGPTKIEDLSIATNIYGAMGNVDSGVPENTAEVMATLQTLLDNGDKWEKMRALVAMGNIRDPDVTLPAAAPFFNSPDELIRSRAYDSFRHAKTPAQFAQFAQRFATEESLLVRREASFVAMTMADSPARNAWAKDLVLSSGDRTIQARGVTILGRGVELYPENEATLRGLLGSVRDREIRKAIYTFVSLKPRGAK